MSKIKIIFKKTINDYNDNKNLFEQFSRHIFEHAFDYTILEFDIQLSSFRLLPCLLTSNILSEFSPSSLSDQF